MLVVLFSSNQLNKGKEEQVLGFNLQSIYTHLEAKAMGAAQSVLDSTDREFVAPSA